MVTTVPKILEQVKEKHIENTLLRKSDVIIAVDSAGNEWVLFGKTALEAKPGPGETEMLMVTRFDLDCSLVALERLARRIKIIRGSCDYAPANG